MNGGGGGGRGMNHLPLLFCKSVEIMIFNTKVNNDYTFYPKSRDMTIFGNDQYQKMSNFY